MENLPEDLIHIKPFLIRSEEMKTADPIVSYYLLRYAVSLAIEYRKQNPGSQVVTDYLSSMLNLMEVKKNEIGNVQSPKDHYEKFITMLFVSADTEDRKSGSTKKTAQKFLILSYFIEAFNVFEDITPEWEEKRVFSKWKAADILKALKRGEKPLAGGPNERTGGEESKRQQPENLGNGGGGYQYSPPQDFNFTSAGTANPPNLGQNPPFVPQSVPQNLPYTPPAPHPNIPQNSPSFPQNPPPPTHPAPTRTPEHHPPPPVRQPPPPKPETRQPENLRTSNRPAKSVLTPEQRKVIDQAKKFGQNAIQELEYKNIQQAILGFQNALKTLETFNN